MPFDAIRDFTPIAMLTRNTMVLVAGANQPFDSLRTMIDYAKRNPGRVGTGSTEALSSFIGQELARRAGVDMPDVAYRSGGQLMNDIVAGHLPTGWTSTVSAAPHMQTGGCASSRSRPGSARPSSPTCRPRPSRASRNSTSRAGSRCWRRRAWTPRWWRRSAAPCSVSSTTRPSSSGWSPLVVERDFRPAPALLEAMQRDDRIWAAAAQAGHIRPQQ